MSERCQDCHGDGRRTQKATPRFSAPAAALGRVAHADIERLRIGLGGLHLESTVGLALREEHESDAWNRLATIRQSVQARKDDPGVTPSDVLFVLASNSSPSHSYSWTTFPSLQIVAEGCVAVPSRYHIVRSQSL